MPGIRIVGSGRYAPGAPVTNADLARVMETDDAWIQRRTGIQARHFAPEGVGPAELARHAAVNALESATLQAHDIDYIMFATMTPDYPFPGSGALLGAALGIPGVPALDIRQQCCAVPFAFQLADALTKSGAAQRILFVGAEAHAGFMPWSNWAAIRGLEDAESVSQEEFARCTRHRGLSVVFGDGAGALILAQDPQSPHGLLGTEVHTDGNGYDQIFMEGGSFQKRPHFSQRDLDEELDVPKMAGRELFKNAVQKLPEVVRSLCQTHDTELDDVDWFIAHQANDRINRAVCDALRVPLEKAPSNIARYGNTSAATIPILMDELIRDRKVQQGDLLCFLALGSGLHWGASLMRL